MYTDRKCVRALAFFTLGVGALILSQSTYGRDREGDDPIAYVISERTPPATRPLYPLATNEQAFRPVVQSNRQQANSDRLGQIIEKIGQESRHKNGSNSSEEISIAIHDDSESEGPTLNATLSSRAALVVKADSDEVLYQKNADLPVSLASISKLMAAMVFLDGKQDLYTPIQVTDEDRDFIKGTWSRLMVCTTLSRIELLHIGLMSSENRAIHALARTYPGGVKAFVVAMNTKARRLGMKNTVFYEPTGLDRRNSSTASDIVKMAKAAYKYPLIREFTTDDGSQVTLANGKVITYRNSNALVRKGIWDVALQKTGYIREAGRCMVVLSKLDNDLVYMVFLGAPSAYSRVSDAENLKRAYHGRYY